MADKKSFVLYCDYRQHFELLPPEDQGRLLMAIFDYVETGAEPSLEPIPMMAFSFIRAQLDRDLKKYEETCKRRAEAGRAGGYAKAANASKAKQALANASKPSKAKQNLANLADNENGNGNGNGNVNGNVINLYRGNSDELPGEKKQTRFIPPTVEEVRAYCRERGNTVNPETFVDFYTGKGWMVGKNKMKDWKAAVRTWEKNRDGHTQARKIDRDDYDNGDQVPW